MIAGWNVSRPELAAQPIAVIGRLARLQAELGPRLEEVFGRFGIRSGDFAILATLTRLRDTSVSQRRLGAELVLSPGTISLRIDRLVRKGLVKRGPDPDDGRGALITLTPRAQELFDACAPEHLTNARTLLAGLTGAEQDQLGMLLGKLLSTLEQPEVTDPLERELGLTTVNAPAAVRMRSAVGLPPVAGILVRHVDPAGAAAASGIRAGDLLTSAGRRPLRTRHDLRRAVSQAQGRRRVAVQVVRGTDALRVQLRAPTGHP